MTAKQPTATTPDNHIMAVRYRRAAILHNSIGTDKLALNTLLTPHWIDEDYFWYRRQTTKGVQFRLVNARLATNQQAFDHQTLADALADATGHDIQAENLPITALEMTLSPMRVNFTADGNRYGFNAEGQLCQTEDESDHSRERLISPNGKQVAFVRGYNLWLFNVESGEEHALTLDGESKNYYGIAPIVYGTGALVSDIQAQWSPDSKRLFTVQTDAREVQSVPIVHYVPMGQNIRPYTTDYPGAFPGDEYVVTQSMVVIDIASNQVQAADYKALPVNRDAWGIFWDGLAWWSANNRHAYFVDMDRGDQVVRLVEFDTDSGATRILFEETSPTNLKLSQSELTKATLLPLPESNELIWFSERSGWGHLYLYNLENGKLKNPITQGNWTVREILYFDTECRELFFQASGRVASRDPYYRDISKVQVDTGEITTLVSTDHEYNIHGPLTMVSHPFFCMDPDRLLNSNGVSPGANYLVATRSRVDQVPMSALWDRRGNLLLEIETADTSGLPKDWRWPEPIKLLAADDKTDIYGVIFRPSDFTPDKQYPVIDYSGCWAEIAFTAKGAFRNGPAAADAWYLMPAALAELGFIVVMIDGRGTPYRERAFLDASYGWVPSTNYAEDRISGIKQLATRHHYIDLNRIGIMGQTGSPGALYGLLQYPDFYKVGVSHRVQDTRLMSAFYGEHHEGITPSISDNYYAEQMVANLQGKLLLIHGLLDPYTPCATTWRVIDALEKANKDFDMLMLPNMSVPLSDYALRRVWDFFVIHLLHAEPPKEFNLNARATEEEE